MFNAQFVLYKNSLLAKIWLAAYWKKKFSKAQICETNVQDAVDQILEPKMDAFVESAFGGAINDSAIHMGDDFGREATPRLYNKNAPGGAIFNDDDFGAGTMDDDDMMDCVPINDNMSIAPLEAPGADLVDDLQLADNNLGDSVPSNQTSDSFALEPFESGAFDVKMQERRKKRRRLIFDEQKNIIGEEMKANMADYSDCLQQLDLAPPTRKLMTMKESGTVERLFHYPGCSAMKSKSLIRIYQNHLAVHARVDSETPKRGEVLSDLGLSNIIEDPYMYAGPPESNCGDYFDDCAPLDFERICVDSPPPMAELQSIQEESPSKDSTNFLSISHFF